MTTDELLDALEKLLSEMAREYTDPKTYESFVTDAAQRIPSDAIAQVRAAVRAPPHGPDETLRAAIRTLKDRCGDLRNRNSELEQELVAARQNERTPEETEALRAALEWRPYVEKPFAFEHPLKNAIDALPEDLKARLRGAK